jgi:hypothetical protein
MAVNALFERGSSFENPALNAEPANQPEGL